LRPGGIPHQNITEILPFCNDLPLDIVYCPARSEECVNEPTPGAKHEPLSQTVATFLGKRKVTKRR
jgi:hypothetical protein